MHSGIMAKIVQLQNKMEEEGYQDALYQVYEQT